MENKKKVSLAVLILGVQTHILLRATLCFLVKASILLDKITVLLNKFSTGSCDIIMFFNFSIQLDTLTR